MEKEIIKIKMFKSFQIEYRNQVIDISGVFGKQLINLFQILAIFSDSEVSRNQLIRMLWADNDNPRNLMKFTIFRLRNKIMEIDVFKDIDLIQTTNDGYRLSEDYRYELDINEFDSIYKELIGKKEYSKIDMKRVMRIMEIYEGSIYETSNSCLWISQFSEKYRKLYCNCVVYACAYYDHLKQYDELMDLVSKALLVEPFNEPLHYTYMKCLIDTNNYQMALDHYDITNEHFYRELGTTLSDRIKELCDSILSTKKEDDVTYSLQDIRMDLDKNRLKPGGFFCSYEMFRHLYELLIKSSLREEKHYFLILIRLHERTYTDNEIRAMNRLKSCIADCLRMSDIFTKISKNQFCLLVTCLELDNAYVITERISSMFYRKNSRNKYRLEIEIQQVS